MLIEHNILGDDRGSLIAIEGNTNIPFEIKRVFYIFGTKENVSRGMHAHFKTQQYLIAVNGHCKVELDDGFKKRRYLLNTPKNGIFKDKLVWITMSDFSADCVLLVMCNTVYNSNDYITDYEKFKRFIKT